MNSTQAATRIGHLSNRAAALVVFFCALAFAGTAAAQPVFSKAFDPNTIGPGSTSLLTFTIENTSGAVVTDLAFTDVLPAGVTIADPGLPDTNCTGGTVTAPDGGTTISLNDGSVGASSICTVTVQVTASMPGTYMNVSGDLTSSAGNSGPATDDLTVSNSRPGFSKTFSPASGPLGTRSTLTFDIDNSANGDFASGIGFTDVLPGGMVIADPSNASTDCGGALTASPGSDTIDILSGFLLSGETCTVSADVVAEAVAALHNSSGTLSSSSDFGPVPSGFATDTFTSTGGPLILVKSFLDDPIAPSGTVDLQFRILNRDSTNPATNISFDDDLDATLTGLTFDSLQSNSCGGSVSGSDLITFSGGSLPARSNCSLEVRLSVPAGATPGIYPNTTSAVTGDLGGTPVVGNAAADDLFVFAVPLLEKTFLDDPAPTGDSTRLEFTITNTSPTSVATDLAFIDELTTFLPFPVSVSLPADGFCGAGSDLSVIALATERQGLSMTGGNLAASASCTFEVTIDLPAGLSSGVYTNTTGEITATVDGATVVGSPASADFEVVAPPRILKSFTDDPVLPGDTVTLEFTLEHDEFAPGDATAIAFDDDLGATLAGLTSLGLPLNDICGVGSQISESMGVLSLTGGVLAPGESCTFSTTLQVPMAANPGNYSNTTSNVTATISGLTATGLTATDDLLITGLSFSKEFIDDPVIAGDTATLRFTIQNDGAVDATGIFFTDDLDANLPGLTVASLPMMACGGPLTDLGGAFVLLSNGSLTAGMTCSFDIVVQVPAAAADGQYGNITSSLSATEGFGLTIPPAADNLEVLSTLLLVSKQFVGDPVQPGDSLTMEIAITNQSATDTVSAIALTDDLDDALSGLTADSIDSNDCGFGVSGVGTGMLSLTGGSLAASASCTVELTLAVPPSAPAGLFTNTTSDATGTAGILPVTGDAASDTFRVVATEFTKSFDGPSVAGGSPVLTFTLTNLDTTSGIGALAFIDNLEAVLPGLEATGLPQSGICGAGSTISGTSSLTFTGGDLAPAGSPGDSCMFQVTLDVPASATAGSFSNVTSDLTSAGLVAGDAAFANLAIEPPPTFGKVFLPNAIAVGGVSTLTFTIDNSASAVAATNLDFTDNLPAGLEVASPANASTTCTGGTVTALSGSDVITYSGGAVSAGASCTVQVDVAGTAEGTLVNTTGDLTSSSGNSGTATDTIDVVSDDFVVSKSFRTAPVLPAGLVEMEISIVNGSAFPLTGISLTDDLDAALAGLVAEGLPMSDVCGTGSQISGTSVVTLTGGNLAASASCTIVVPVRVPADAPEGAFNNVTSIATGTREGVAVEGDPDDADLIVALLEFTKSLNPDIAAQDSNVTATFSIVNPDPANAVTALEFSDDLNAFVPGMTAINTPITAPCGAGSGVAGTNTITLTGGSIGGGGSCSFDVTLNVPADTSGDFTNTTSVLAGEIDGTMISVAAASDELSVPEPPAFAKAFDAAEIKGGENSVLTFTIDNTGSQLPAEDLAFTDNLPTGLMLADTPSASSTCTGGSFSAAPGGTTFGYSGGTAPANAVCTVSVAVTADDPGVYNNVSEDLTSTLGNSGNASASLTVTTQPAFGKAFAPDTISGGDTSVLTFTVDNSTQPLAANNLAFIDTLPTGLVLADTPAASTTCSGGSFSATAGAGTFGYSGGSVAANAMCTVSVTVTANNPGVYDNVSGDLTSSLGNSGTASASLNVTTQPMFAKAFAPDTISGGDISVLTFTIDNSAQPLAANNLAFTDNLPTGLVLANPPVQINFCNGTLDAMAAASSFSLINGSVAAGETCTVLVNVTASDPGVYDNVSGDLISSLGNSGTASASLNVTTQPTFAKAFAPDTISGGDTSVLTFTIDNSAQPLAANNLTFTDNLPTGLVLADNPAPSTTCSSGSFNATAGADSLFFSDGSVAANTSCTVSVTVTADDPGEYDNTSGDLNSSLGNSGTASATLTVTTQPIFTKAFAPDTINGGDTSVLTFTIDNTAQPLEADDLAFTDPLPTGLVLADTPAASTTCSGGSFSATPGDDVFSYDGGSITAGAECTVSVTVTSTVPGEFENLTEDLTSSLGNSGTATATLTVSEDSDGVPADIEDMAPNNGDGNGDSIPDRIQDDVASLPTFNDNGFITVAITSGCDQLNNVAALSPTSQAVFPGNLEFAFGLVGFELPCENAVVDVIFAGDTTLLGNTYFKFAPTTPGQPDSAAWFDFSDTPAGAPTGATRNGNVWTLTLADNQLGDATGDDGVIVDPGGPAQQFLPIPLAHPLLLLLLAAFVGMIGGLAVTRSTRNHG